MNFLQSNNIFSIFIFLALVAGSVLFADFLKAKKSGTEKEVLRKVPHILIGIIFSLAPTFMSGTEIMLSAAILVVGVFAGKYSPFFKSVFSIKRITYGMWLTPLSLGILSFLWLPENKVAFIFGILVLTFSDAFAALVGKFFGKHRNKLFKKTTEGSSAFFLTTIILFFILSPEIKIWNFIWISAILTAMEFVLIFGLDNLFLPIIASTLFYFFI